MTYFRSLATATVLLAALLAVAQSPASDANAPGQAASGPSSASVVQTQMAFLSDSLSLTGEQQAKLKPILQDMHTQTAKIMQDNSLSTEERHAKLHALHMSADQQVREFLSVEQKQKLDQVEHERHPELHPDITGNPPTTN